MKNQALFSSKDKSKKLKCRLLQFLFGALRVNKYCSDPVSRNPISGHCLQISCCVFYVVCYQYGLIFQHANLPLVTFLKNLLTFNFMPLWSR